MCKGQCQAHQQEELTDIQEMLAVAAVEFSMTKTKEFEEYLKANHPYLHQVYFVVQGEG